MTIDVLACNGLDILTMGGIDVLNQSGMERNTGLPTHKITQGSNNGCVVYAPLWHPYLSGTSFKTLDTNAFNFTITGTTYTANVGRAFDGDDLINTDSAVASLKTVAGTLEAWAKLPDVTPATQMPLFWFGKTTGLDYLYLLIETNGKITAAVILNSVTQWLVSTDSGSLLTNDVFAHIALTHNGTTPTIIVNGAVPAQTFTTSTNKTLWLSSLAAVDNGRIGCVNYNNLGNTLFSTCTVGEYRAYNRALSTAELVNNRKITQWRYS